MPPPRPSALSLHGSTVPAIAIPTGCCTRCPHRETGRRIKRLPGAIGADQRSHYSKTSNEYSDDPSHASLAELNRYIRSATDVGTDTQVTGETVAPPEMKSVRHFKHAWSRMRAQDQVLKAVQQGPENAGPLNSHRLVLRSLSLMRDLSPDYLQRFLSHTESLLWLDHLSVKIAAMDSKTARRSRPKKQ